MKRFCAELLLAPGAVPLTCPRTSAAAGDFDQTAAGTIVPPIQKPGSTFTADAGNRGITFRCASRACFAAIAIPPRPSCMRFQSWVCLPGKAITRQSSDHVMEGVNEVRDELPVAYDPHLLIA